MAKTLSQSDLVSWAIQKFGPTVQQLAPNAAELQAVYAYYQSHPGAPTNEITNLLAAQRSRAKTAAGPQPASSGSPSLWDDLKGLLPGNSPTFGGQSPDLSVGAPPSTTPAPDPTAAAPSGGYMIPLPASSATATKPGANPPVGSLAAQAAAALKAAGAGSTAGGPSLDNFDANSKVFIDGNTPHPTSGGGGTNRYRDPGDQITGTTMSTGAPPEASTLQDVMTGIYKMDAAALLALKKQLWAGGFYPAGTDPSVISSSVPDVQTRNAYLLAAQQSARLAEAGKTTTIAQIIAMGNPDPAKSTGASSLGPYSITSPVDLKSALQSAAQSHLGRDLTPAEEGDFAKLYNGMEAQSSIRSQAAAGNNQQVGIVSPPSPGASAEDYLAQHFAGQQQAYGAVQRQQAFYSMLGAIA